jgi:hypothetical protein
MEDMPLKPWTIGLLIIAGVMSIVITILMF